MRNFICLQRFAARKRRPYSRLIAGVAAIAMLATTASPGFAGGVFSPNNLVVSRSAYAGTASTITVGETLPPGCTAGPVAVPLLVGGTVNVTIPAGPTGCNAGPAPG